jgi:hypothetical protein
MNVDALFVAPGSTFIVAADAAITLRSGQHDVFGTLVHRGTLSQNPNALLTMKNGSVYDYNRNGSFTGAPVLTATWNVGSTCQLTKVMDQIPSGLSQTFHHFIYNCPNQNIAQNLPNGFNARGNVQFIDSGPGSSTRVVYFTGNAFVGGNLTVSALSEIRCSAGSTVTFNGTAAQTYQNNSASHYFNNLTINNPAGVQSLGNLWVTTTLHLQQGHLDLGGHTVFTAHGCTVRRSAGSVANASLATGTGFPNGKYNLVYAGTFVAGIELTASPTYLNDLTIAGTVNDVVTLDKDANVNGVLTLTAGKLRTTGNFKVYVRNGADNAVVYNNNSTNSSYIIGDLRRDIGSNIKAYEFPVGSQTNGQNVQVKLNGLMGVGFITVSFSPVLAGTTPNPAACIAANVPVNTLYNAGYWIIHPDVQPTGGTYDVRIRGKGGSNPPASAAMARVIKRDNTSTPWQAPGEQDLSYNTITAGELNVRVKSLTSFSDFGIGYGNNVLPITLASFDAKPDGRGDVVVAWSTSAELNNAFFSLERSSDGTAFEEINMQEGAGTSTTFHAYQFTDETPLAGTSYYRLKQVDFGGAYTYSQIRVVSAASAFAGNDGSSAPFNFYVYPNPSTGVFKFTNVRTKGKSGTASVTLYNMKGQAVHRQTFADGETISIDLTSHAPGVYTANVVDAEGKAATQQLVVQR